MTYGIERGGKVGAMGMTETIFTTIHGSHLYGLAHEGSDHDMFTVNTMQGRRARQSVVGDVDYVRVGLDGFLDHALSGSHQSVEALFSPYKVWGESILAQSMRPFLEGLLIAGPDVYAKYERTIKAFCFGDFKCRRHAVRLASNLLNLRAEGRFNPVMTPAMITYANTLAERFEGRELWEMIN